MSAHRLQLGAPGIYRVAPTPEATLAGVRLDACAFVGVAPRGPAWVPVRDRLWRDDMPTVWPGRPRRRCVAVRVDSFTAYQRLYGGFEGPGRLPHAVRSFFENGGREAWIVRVTAPQASDESALPGVGKLALPKLTRADGPAAELRARSEGVWSNRLTAALGYVREPLRPSDGSTTALYFERDDCPAIGSTVLVRPDGSHPIALRTIVDARVDRGRVEALLSAALPDVADVAIGAELVTAELWLDDGDGRVEHHRQLGLSPLHPRWLATVLCHESILAWPDEGWVELDLVPELVDGQLASLDPGQAVRFEGGSDRYARLGIDDFFDDAWDPRGEVPGEGVAALADAPAVASVVTPDLYHPTSLLPDLDVSDVPDLGSADWEACPDVELEVEVAVEGSDDAPPPTLPGLTLDPRVPAELAQIVAAQQRLVALVERLAIVALLDVPPSLEQREILAWRAKLSSSWAAAYHPWLRLARRADVDLEEPVRLGPSAVAAGIIARRELAFGIPHGPANELALGVVDVEDRVGPRRHDQLHPRAINVLLRERDGVRLTAARTLSGDPALRQLSVRRLMQLLHRTLERELEWVVFEPNGPRLRTRLRDTLRTFLRKLYRQGAFRGATEAEAFFVRCDEDNNPRVLGDRGQLLAEIGVAPAEPIEFIVLALVREEDGRVEVRA